MDLVPNYYNKFNCIADKCKHSCCIGWEIDIDEETMFLYNALNDEMGEKIRENIGGEVPHFILKEGDRCPFLNESGLCDIILKYGEDAICDICFLHPRFKKFYSSFTETGLGLCCEEAARIILTQKEKFSIPQMNENVMTEELEFFKKRNEIFEKLQNRNQTIGERLYNLAYDFGLKFDFSLKSLCDILLSLEKLDDNWTQILKDVCDYNFDKKIFYDKNFDILFEQLAVYFIFRHLSCVPENEDYKKVIRFTLISCYMIGALFSEYIDKSKTIESEAMIDYVRMYSSEIEYCQDNIDALMNFKGE